MCGIFKKLLDEHHKPNQANSDHDEEEEGSEDEDPHSQWLGNQLDFKHVRSMYVENDEDQDEDEELDLNACMRAKRRQSTSDCCLITSMVPAIYTGHGIFYFEMMLKEDRRSSGNPTAGIGFTSDVSSGYNDFPGWGFNSIGYHGDDGTVVFHHEQLKNNLRTYGVGDIVGAGIGMFVS